MSNEQTPWVQAQKKTFENWVNQSLLDKDIHIDDIKVGFKTGVNLYHLYQQLTSKKIKEIDLKPKMKISYLLNLNCVIDKFKEDKVKIVNVQGEDIHDENLKLILGFTWMLIQHYHILGSSDERSSRASKTPKAILLKFVNDRIAPKSVSNFQDDWKDGEVLSDLIEAIQPGSLPVESRPDSAAEKVKKALQVADENLGVPKVIEEDFILSAADELSLMTYATYLRKKYEENLMQVHAPNCVASGDGLKFGKNKDSPHSFQIELRNIYDELCPVELEKSPLTDIDPKFTGPRDVQFNSKMVSKGVYEISYDAVYPGEYTIDVTIPAEGPRIKDSPFSATIEKTPPKFSGDGLEDGKIEEDKKKTIEIDSGTKNGGLLEEGLSAKVTGPDGSELPVEMTDNEDGTYQAAYSPASGGKHKVAVSLWDEAALEQEVDLSSGKKAEGAVVKVTGEMVDKKHFPNNRATGLVVTVNDADGKPITGLDVDLDVKNDKGEKVGVVTVEESPSGEYEVNLDGVEEKGPYSAVLSVDGEPRETFTSECLEGTQPELVEGSFTFAVVARDRHGEPKTVGGDLWEVDVEGPDGAQIDVETADHGDGRYSATYHLAAQEGGPSTFTVNARLDGQHVASSPFKHQLAPKPSVGQRLKNFFRRK